MSHTDTDRILDELRNVLHDAEELLRATAGQAGEKAAEARARAQASVAAARDRLAGLGEQAADRVRAAGERADQYAHSNPWTVVGLAAVAGLLAGLLLSRRGGPR